MAPNLHLSIVPPSIYCRISCTARLRSQLRRSFSSKTSIKRSHTKLAMRLLSSSISNSDSNTLSRSRDAILRLIVELTSSTPSLILRTRDFSFVPTTIFFAIIFVGGLRGTSSEKGLNDGASTYFWLTYHVLNVFLETSSARPLIVPFHQILAAKS